MGTPAPFDWSGSSYDDVTQWPTQPTSAAAYYQSLPDVNRPWCLREILEAIRTWAFASTPDFVVAKNGSGDSTTIKGLKSQVSAGDIVEIRAGTYADTISPDADGTIDQPIVYLARPGDKVTISTSGGGDCVALSSKSHVHVLGARGPWWETQTTTQGLFLNGAPYTTDNDGNPKGGKWVQFQNGTMCSVQGAWMQNINVSPRGVMFDATQYCAVLNSYLAGSVEYYADLISCNNSTTHNRFLFDGCDAENASHDVIDLRNSSNSNVNAYTTSGGHCVTRNRFSNAWHRLFGTFGIPCALIADNFLPQSGIGNNDTQFGPATNGKVWDAEVDFTHMWGRRLIYRHNCGSKSGSMDLPWMSCLMSVSAYLGNHGDNNTKFRGPRDHRVYHNTFFNIWGSTVAFGDTSNSSDDEGEYGETGGHKYLNNITYRVNERATDLSATYHLDGASSPNYVGGVEIRGNMMDPTNGKFFESNTGTEITNAYATSTANGVAFNSNSQGEPEFESVDFTDYENAFQIGASSDAIGAGVDLTYAVGNGTDESELVVEDALFFCGGMGCVPPEWIQIGNSTLVQVAEVDWSTNTLRLLETATWSDGDRVNFPHAAALPDVGARQYDAPVVPPLPDEPAEDVDIDGPYGDLYVPSLTQTGRTSDSITVTAESAVALTSLIGSGNFWRVGDDVAFSDDEATTPCVTDSPIAVLGGRNLANLVQTTASKRPLFKGNYALFDGVDDNIGALFESAIDVKWVAMAVRMDSTGQSAQTIFSNNANQYKVNQIADQETLAGGWNDFFFFNPTSPAKLATESDAYAHDEDLALVMIAGTGPHNGVFGGFSPLSRGNANTTGTGKGRFYGAIVSTVDWDTMSARKRSAVMAILNHWMSS